MTFKTRELPSKDEQIEMLVELVLELRECMEHEELFEEYPELRYRINDTLMVTSPEDADGIGYV